MQRLNFHTWVAEHKELLNLPLRVLAFHVSLVFGERCSKDKVQRAIRTGALVLHHARHTPKNTPTREHYAVFFSLYQSLFERVFPAPSKVQNVKECVEHEKCYVVKRKNGQVFHSPAKENRVRATNVPYLDGVRLDRLTVKNKVEQKQVATLEMFDLARKKKSTIPVFERKKVRDGAYVAGAWGTGLYYVSKEHNVVDVQDFAHLKECGKLTFKTTLQYIESEKQRTELGRVLRFIRTLFLTDKDSLGLHLVGSPLLQGKRTWKTLLTERDLLNETCLVLWYLILAGHGIVKDAERLTAYLCGVAEKTMLSYFSLVSIPVVDSDGISKLNKDGEPLTKRVRRFQPMFYLSQVADIYQRPNGLYELVSTEDTEE